MKTKILMLAVLMMMAMCGCDKELGEYVYKDCVNVIHTDKDCIKKNCLGSKNEKVELVGIKGVRFIRTNNLPYEWQTYPSLCPYCVNDRQADQIRALYNMR